MYSGVIALGGPKSWTGIGASLYFILLVILGNCILDSTDVYLLVNIIAGTLARKEAFWLLLLFCFCFGRGDDVDLRRKTN